MELSISTTSYGVDDLRWLASREGTDTARSITITTSGFTVNSDGFIPSGTAVTPDAATGRYKIWSTGLPLSGFLLTPVRVKNSSINHVAPLIDRGRINTSHLPTAGKPDATGQATAPRFVFITDASI
jgi:hypothetical protein